MAKANPETHTMRQRHKFRPTAFGEVALEPRIALSHSAIVAPAGAPGLPATATARGNVTITLPERAGGEYAASLTANSRLQGIGPVRLIGRLTSNPSLPPEDAGLRGAISITSMNRHKPGFLTMTVNGSPTTFPNGKPIPMTFRIIAASGSLNSALGHTGDQILVVQTRIVPRAHGTKGTFILTAALHLG